jgi:hypothetical protein
VAFLYSPSCSAIPHHQHQHRKLTVLRCLRLCSNSTSPGAKGRPHSLFGKKGFRPCSFPMIDITCHRLQLLILSQGLHFFFHILQREENTKWGFI